MRSTAEKSLKRDGIRGGAVGLCVRVGVGSGRGRLLDVVNEVGGC